MKLALFAIFALAILAVLAAFILANRKGADLAAEYDARLLSLKPAVSVKPFSEQDMAHLPDPVKRYMHRSGAIGKPPIASVHVEFDTVLYRDPGSTGMKGPSHQIDIVDPPRRLFFMKTRMYGLPVAVLHDYDGDKATMRVRLAGLFDVANVGGKEISRTETVTVLNDLAAFAPSALVGPKFRWTAVDGTHADVAYTNGDYTVSARLTFNAEGDLIDFISNDRGELQKDGTLKVLPWSTPLSSFREFAGRRVPGKGEAIFHRETGPFTYGIFNVTNVTFNQAAEHLP
jgi:hypothetical protein